MLSTRRVATAWILAASLGAAGCGDGDETTPSASSGGGGAGQGDGGAGAAGGWDARYQPFVDALLEDLAASRAYGVSVAVMEGGEVTFAEAFGSKDADGLEPLTPETLMQIGSTTKQMTAVALLRKVEQGLLSVDDSLADALPSLSFANDGSWSSELLVHHLLSHQGGFYDSLPWFDTSDDADLAAYTYGTFADEWFLISPPGAFWNYSNPNFVLAGLVTEELDDRAWPDIMREDLFAPLGMERTYLRKSEVEADGDFSLSHGIVSLTAPSQRDVAMAEVGDSAWVRPAGLAWTTPTQMMQWARFILHGDPEVLSDALRAEVTSEQVDTLYQAGTMHYGYGEFVTRGYLTVDGTWYETPVWEHGGNTLSFSHLFTMLPELDFAVSICSSAYSTDFDHSMDVAVTTLASLPSPSAGPEYTFDPTALDRHVGTYDEPWGTVGTIDVTRDGDTLVVDIPALTAAGLSYVPELLTISSDIFYLSVDGVPYDLTFIPLEPGGSSQYVRNRQFVVTRTAQGGGQSIEPHGEDGARNRTPPPPPVDVARWRSSRALAPSPVRWLSRLP